VVHDIGQHGIFIQSSDDALVADNKIFDSGKFGNGDDAALKISGDDGESFIVEGNLIRDNAGFRVDVGDSFGELDVADVSTNNNCIEGNLNGGLANNIESEGNAKIDAENNWWGAASGPSPGGTGDKVIGDVDFFPFLMEKSACGAPPISAALPPCKECAESPCSCKQWDLRFARGRHKMSLGIIWFDKTPKAHCAKGKDVAEIFEEDLNAVCGPCES